MCVPLDFFFFFFEANTSQIIAGSLKSRLSVLEYSHGGSLIGGQNANGPITWLDLPRLWSLPPQAGISRSCGTVRVVHRFIRSWQRPERTKGFSWVWTSFGRSWIKDKMLDGCPMESIERLSTHHNVLRNSADYLSCQLPNKQLQMGPTSTLTDLIGFHINHTDDLCVRSVELSALCLTFLFSQLQATVWIPSWVRSIACVCGRWTNQQQIQRSALQSRRCQAESASIANNSYVVATFVQSSGGCLK